MYHPRVRLRGLDLDAYYIAQTQQCLKLPFSTITVLFVDAVDDLGLFPRSADARATGL